MRKYINSFPAGSDISSIRHCRIYAPTLSLQDMLSVFLSPSSPLPHRQHRLPQQQLGNLSYPKEGPQMTSRTLANRKKHTQACIPCQSSKRRCSSGLPCSHCIRRNCESSCVYNRDRRRRRPETPSLSLPISEHDSILTGFESQSPPSPLPQSQSHAWLGPQPPFPMPSTPDEAQDSAQAAADNNVPDETPEDHVFTQPRIVKDSSGNDGMIRHAAICFSLDRGKPSI